MCPGNFAGPCGNATDLGDVWQVVMASADGDSVKLLDLRRGRLGVVVSRGDLPDPVILFNIQNLGVVLHQLIYVFRIALKVLPHLLSRRENLVLLVEWVIVERHDSPWGYWSPRFYTWGCSTWVYRS